MFKLLLVSIALTTGYVLGHTDPIDKKTIACARKAQQAGYLFKIIKCK